MQNSVEKNGHINNIEFDGENENKIEQEEADEERDTYSYFNATIFIPQTISNLCVLLTFGIVCPILAIPLCMSIILSLLYHQLLLGRLATNLSQIVDGAERLTDSTRPTFVTANDYDFKGRDSKMFQVENKIVSKPIMSNRIDALEADCAYILTHNPFSARWIIVITMSLFFTLFVLRLRVYA